MAGSLREQTALLVADYLAQCGPGPAPPAPPPSPAAATLRRAAAALRRQHRPFFVCARRRAGAGAGPGDRPGDGDGAGDGDGDGAGPAALLAQVAAELDHDGGLNWGRVVALVALAGALLDPEPDPRTPDLSRTLADTLCHYLAEEKGDWLREHGGWDGFYHFFNQPEGRPAEQNSAFCNAIMAAAGFGLAGLAFLLAVR
ncbi:bcl-2-like protein 10 [Ornithorhynchus anatinus]|uniref:BCL2 like 10 n=1 Tax=Ornithorhynchus anatinus TaxID=9258 RepID=A0A6I8NZN5_ORNAN|nr:bcl-2-like protein 10 [Ornithorhynchus anatinus]